ncbi:MAG TPA: NUDIX hydrolase [Candidatus Paceibacterota bacterium]|nr:NUDIX hydrolase [Candidatus Paceibacterota bacterium]HRZ55273.1 NUDIX hydrolase [Candidatus Paceibacterota bacterium]
MIEPWPTLESKTLGDFRVFRVRQDFKRSPRTGQAHNFFVLECPGWVNIIALTPDRDIILVEQYRHGVQTVELEVPGGVMDADDASPVETAVRELREETGFEGENAVVIGRVAPNPAIQNNIASTVLIENCVRRHEVEFDHTEDVVTMIEKVDALPLLVASGRIRHSLIIAAFYHFDLWQRGLAPNAPRHAPASFAPRQCPGRSDLAR